MNEPPILISPKARFLAAQKAAAAHTERMASPAFIEAASVALLQYQYTSIGGDPQVMAIAAAKLRGAQEYLRILMNLGLPEPQQQAVPDGQLTPPEQLLRAFDPFVTKPK